MVVTCVIVRVPPAASCFYSFLIFCLIDLSFSFFFFWCSTSHCLHRPSLSRRPLASCLLSWKHSLTHSSFSLFTVDHEPGGTFASCTVRIGYSVGLWFSKVYHYNRCIITSDAHSLCSDPELLFTAWDYPWKIDKIPFSMGCRVVFKHFSLSFTDLSSFFG